MDTHAHTQTHPFIYFSNTIQNPQQIISAPLRSSMSPKHHSKAYPLECKPNINDLRQLFDDNSRAENRKNHRHSAIYADAKHTSLDESIFDNYKGIGIGNGGGGSGYHQSQAQSQSQSIVMAAIPSTRNPDFERVKQKFDKPSVTNSASSSSSTRNGKKARNFSSFLKFNNKRSDTITSSNGLNDSVASKVPNNSNLTESIDSVDSTKAVAGDSLSNKKIDAYMHSSINIDGLKVSDDEEVSIAAVVVLVVVFFSFAVVVLSPYINDASIGFLLLVFNEMMKIILCVCVCTFCFGKMVKFGIFTEINLRFLQIFSLWYSLSLSFLFFSFL